MSFICEKSVHHFYNLSFIQEKSVHHFYYMLFICEKFISTLIWTALTQGDPVALMRYYVALQPSLRLLDTACRVWDCGGMSRSWRYCRYWTRTHYASRFPLWINLPEGFRSATYSYGKEVVFMWYGELPEGTPAWLTLGGFGLYFISALEQAITTFTNICP